MQKIQPIHLWNQFIGKKVRLIIDDIPYPHPKDGIFEGFDDTHIWILIKGKELSTPFNRNKVIRIDVREENT